MASKGKEELAQRDLGGRETRFRAHALTPCHQDEGILVEVGDSEGQENEEAPRMGKRPGSSFQEVQPAK